MENDAVLLENLLDLIKEQKQSRGQSSGIPKPSGRHVRDSNYVRSIAEIVQILNRCKPADVGEAATISCNNCLAQYFAQGKTNLEEHKLNGVVKWLERAFALSEVVECSALIAITNLLKCHQNLGAHYWEQLFHPKRSTILQRLQQQNAWNERLAASVQCMDTVLASLSETQMSDEQLAVCEAVAGTLLRIHYAEPAPTLDASYVSQFILHSLSLLNKINALCPSFAQQHIAEQFGLAKTYMHFYADVETTRLHPQKLAPSQQMMYDSAEEVDALESSAQARSAGGKIAKRRKPRAAAKAANVAQQSQRLSSDAHDMGLHSFEIKVSDSETSASTSETETAASGNSSLTAHDRSQRAKIRLLAIALLGVVARSQERRILYSYWHAIFPTLASNAGSEEKHSDLLQLGQRDPNVRCRSAALQVASQLIAGSKAFLSQAEYGTTPRSAAFLPFAQSLGLMVWSMYDALISILASEPSLPVVMQALKCLALLVQATPFQRFQTGLVCRFVPHVQRLVHHRDSALQVSALTVMEFLLAAPELTKEITEAVGLPATSIKKAATLGANVNQQNDESSDFIEITDDLEVEYEEDELESVATTAIRTLELQQRPNASSSWLLLRVLYNLDGTRATASVRIESLQVISAMCTHFSLVAGHLEGVAKALANTLQDSVPDVRLYAARTFDNCSYQLARHLLSASNSSSHSTAVFSKEQCYWETMLPLTIALIRGDDKGVNQQMPAVKVCLCDALSNIGIVIFERLPHGSQMQLLSFLSGISSDSDEEAIVRAAATRALAVYVLFPSLRDNLVFIENVSESILLLVSDSNLLVRIKAYWAMGNVSDALLANYERPTTHERISDGLLHRLIETATNACSKDNDKVRCNAVRTLGNLLRLLSAQHFDDANYRLLLRRAVCKLIDCIRASGNAKVKWNSCYAIGNIMRHNNALFEATRKYADLDWQSTLYPALCHIIVHHSNFKVRINATAAIMHISERAHYGKHFEAFWIALLAAIEQSYNLDNFYEYNHRDNLQEQLCLAICHVLACATLPEDFLMLKTQLVARLEVVRNTWTRVTNRMVPEKAAPLLACAALLQERFKSTGTSLGAEQRNAVLFIAQTFDTPT